MMEKKMDDTILLGAKSLDSLVIEEENCKDQKWKLLFKEENKQTKEDGKHTLWRKKPGRVIYFSLIGIHVVLFCEFDCRESERRIIVVRG